MKNCKSVEPLISEYVSGTLSPHNIWGVQSHIASCTDCARLTLEFRTISELVRTLPVRQPSAAFDSQLAASIANVKAARIKQPWYFFFRGQLTAGRPRLRPLLACTTATVLLGSLFMVTDLRVGLQRTDDAVLLAHCVLQHQTDLKAQLNTDQSTKTDALSDFSDSNSL